MVESHETVGDEPEFAVAVRALLNAFSERDRATIERLIALDCTWRVPGVNALAGDYVGRPAVLAMLGRLKRIFTGPAQFEIVDIATSTDRAMVYQYGAVVVRNQRIRLKECLIFRFEAGQIVEVDEFQYDQAAFDAAFSPEVVAAVLSS